LSTTQKQVDESPEIFGPYEVFERVGVGGMATVHRAKERGIEDFERIVALKRLLPHLAEDASFVRSFVREAKLASMLQHSNIVQLYELGRVGQVLFISMEYIEGRDIRKLLRRARKVAGPPPVPVVISLMTQLCDALDYAHHRMDGNGQPLGLVHRDVSPSNVLVTESGHVKVIDFGIAKAQSAHLKTQTGRVKGKIAYMAPESVRGQDLDARSDIFSAGVIAHELLTARPLFSTKNEYETLLRVQRAEIDPPSRFNPDCPPALDELVLHALERDPADRWPTAGHLRDALEHLRVQLGVSATPREVSSWMEWAFSLEEPPSATLRRRGDSTSFSAVSETIPSNVFSPISRSGSVSGGLPSPAQVVALPGVPSLRGGKRGDDEDADMAWGSLEEEAAQANAALDDIPDVSIKIVSSNDRPTTMSGTVGAASATPAAPRSEASAFGSGMIAAHRKSRAGAFMAVGVLLAVAAGVAAYVVLRPRPEVASAPAAPTTAVLKFSVEPTDAVIAVRGEGRHQGAALRLEVEAPATYHIEITREGYKSYVSEIELEPGEIRTMQVALQSGASQQASLAVRSSPPAQSVMLDGRALGQRTPLDLEVAPGVHVLAIVDDAGKELWRHEFEASPNTQYEFHPALQETVPAARPPDDDDDEDRDRRRRRSRDDALEQLAAAAAEAGPSGTTPAPSALDEADTAPAEVAAAAAAEDEAADEASGEEPGEGEGAVAVAGAAEATRQPEPPAPAPAVVPPPRSAPVPPPAPVAARAPRNDRPVMVSGDKVKRRSGGLPQLEAAKRGELPDRIKALLCIDTRGAVTSVQIYNELRAPVVAEIEQALRRWRYAPYEQNGKAVDACFGIVFRTVLH
jgi:serine/threonine protein kinase